MGVYINMEMPTKCGNCFLRRGECKQRIYMESKPSACPLIPVPPHGRLIDADALERDMSHSVVFSGRENNPEIYGAGKIVKRIHLAPTIIPAEEEQT